MQRERAYNESTVLSPCHEIIPVTRNDGGKYRIFLHPHLHDLLEQADGNDHLLFFGAQVGGEPSGLVLARWDPVDCCAEILSIFVLPLHRRMGLGSKLLGAVERCWENCFELRIICRKENADYWALSALLEKAGWHSETTNSFIFCIRNIHPGLGSEVRDGAREYTVQSAESLDKRDLEQLEKWATGDGLSADRLAKPAGF